MTEEIDMVHLLQADLRGGYGSLIRDLVWRYDRKTSRWKTTVGGNVSGNITHCITSMGADKRGPWPG